MFIENHTILFPDPEGGRMCTVTTYDHLRGRDFFAKMFYKYVTHSGSYINMRQYSGFTEKISILKEQSTELNSTLKKGHWGQVRNDKRHMILLFLYHSGLEPKCEQPSGSIV
jgi:hypothetical protein